MLIPALHKLAAASLSFKDSTTSTLARMASRRHVRPWAMLAFMLPAYASALPFVWETVTLPASSGAACADGSPYRFFVNRNPLTTKTVVMFEGGGACWTQGTCVNKEGSILSAVNPNGIPENYMSSLDAQAKLGLVTPFTSRVPLLGTTVQTQSWNMVYVSYCTGDTHIGNKVSVYTDTDPANPRVEYHRGNVNVQAVAAWMKKNMARPDQLLVTGFSAGGVGSTAQYATIRESLNPKRSALLADSGPLYPAPRTGTAAQYPSLPLHNTIRSAWGLDDSAGIITQSLQKYPGAFDFNNLGSVTVGLARLFPNDRLGYALFQQDADFSNFSYQEFFPEIKSATGDVQKQLINAKWRQDIGNWTTAMNQGPSNLGYYIPYGRPVNMSHCLTIATFDGTGIDDLWIPSVGTFVDNLLASSGTPLIRAVQQTQKMQPTTAIEWLLINVLGLA